MQMAPRPPKLPSGRALSQQSGHLTKTSFEAEVRRVDEDRWLASRFAPSETRAKLCAIIALNHAIASIGDVRREPTLGVMRLAWWRERLEDIACGAPVRAQPALSAFAEAGLSVGAALAMLEARAADLEAAPFADWAQVERYLQHTAGNVFRLSFEACGVNLDDDAINTLGMAWGFCGLARAEPYWRAQGRRIAPKEHVGPLSPALIERARTHYCAARELVSGLEGAAFPAFGYVALAPGYLKRLERAHGDHTPLLLRQMRLIGAAATGRI